MEFVRRHWKCYGEGCEDCANTGKELTSFGDELREAMEIIKAYDEQDRQRKEAARADLSQA